MLDKIYKKVDSLVPLVFTIATVLALSINFSNKSVNKMIEGYNYLHLITAFLLYNFYKKNTNVTNKRASYISIVFGLIIALVDVIGSSFEYYNSFYIFSNIPSTLLSIIRFIGIYLMVFYISYFLIDKYLKKEYVSKENKKSIFFSANKKSFFINLLIILACYIPYYLLFRPGIFSVDSNDQMMQIVNNAYTNHHPFIHTMLIKLFMNIGKVFNSIIFGLHLYTLFQMLVMAGIFSYTIFYMNKKNVYKPIRIAALLYYALFPIHGFYAITMWKDILFAGFFLLLTIFIIELSSNKEIFKRKINYLYFIFLSSMVMLFRNNGFYVIVLLFPVLFILLKSYRKQIAIVFIIILGINAIYKGPIFRLYGVKEGSIREALSIPLQQFARLKKDVNDKLSDEEIKSINSVFTVSNIEAYYMDRLSDSVKNKFNEEYFKNNKKEFLTNWLKLGLKHPIVYTESFIANSFGYWYPNTKNWMIWYSYTWNKELEFKYVRVNNEMAYSFGSLVANEVRSLPFIGSLFSIGTNFLLLVFLLLLNIYKKRYKNIIAFIPILLLFLTVLASPVYAEFRYIYSLFLVIIPLMGITLQEKAK